VTEPAFEMCPDLLETRFYAAYGVPAFGSNYGCGSSGKRKGFPEFRAIVRLVSRTRR